MQKITLDFCEWLAGLSGCCRCCCFCCLSGTITLLTFPPSSYSSSSSSLSLVGAQQSLFDFWFTVLCMLCRHVGPAAQPKILLWVGRRQCQTGKQLLESHNSVLELVPPMAITLHGFPLTFIFTFILTFITLHLLVVLLSCSFIIFLYNIVLPLYSCNLCTVYLLLSPSTRGRW